jgi:hypothetical protein
VAAAPGAGRDRAAAEVADEERALRRLEVVGLERRLVGAAVPGDVLLLDLLDQPRGVRMGDRHLDDLPGGEHVGRSVHQPTFPTITLLRAVTIGAG